MGEKILSIVIPAYNVEKYIKTCMGSLIEREELLEDLDVIIVNDGSKDGTASIARHYADRFPLSVRAIHKINGGHGSAINEGILHAKGKYLRILDGDDWAANSGLAELISRLKTLDADMVVSPFDIVHVDTGRTESVDFNMFEYNKTYDFCDLNKHKMNVPMHAIVFKTDIFQENKIKIDEKMYYVDTEYILFPVPYVRTIVFLKDAVYQYRLGTDEQSMNFRVMQKNRRMHGKVIFSILDYYEEYKALFSNSQKEYYFGRLREMISLQTYLYLRMKETMQAKRELEEFMRRLEQYRTEECFEKKLAFLKNTSWFGFFSLSLFFKIRYMLLKR